MSGTGADVLRNKRDATRYRILVEVARRQPAVSQREIADAVGVTAQAVSEHLRELGESGYVDRETRGRYRVTNEGVDWLISETESLREYVDRVATDVIGDVEVDTAVAAGRIVEGDRVAVEMRDGLLTAVPLGDGPDRAHETGDGPDDDRFDARSDEHGINERGDDGRETDERGVDDGEADGRAEGGRAGATAVAVTDAAAGTDVGVTEFDGVVDYELGRVTAVEVPDVRAGGSRAVADADLRERADAHDLVVVAGVEARVAAREASVTADVHLGTEDAVAEAVAKGLDVLLVVVTDQLADHTDRLRELSVAYEVVEPDNG